jgi:cytochrome P450
MRVEDHRLMDPEIQANPYAYYLALHEQAPVYLMPDSGAYLVSRYRDVQYVISHPEIWSNDLLGKGVAGHATRAFRPTLRNTATTAHSWPVPSVRVG